MWPGRRAVGIAAMNEKLECEKRERKKAGQAGDDPGYAQPFFFLPLTTRKRWDE